MKKLFFISFISIVSLNGGFLDAIKEFNSVDKEQTSIQEKSSNKLLNSIQNATNLTTPQTIGTLSTILNYAKNNIDDKEYSNIIKKVPALESFTNENQLSSFVSSTLKSNKMVNNSLETLGVKPEIVKVVIPIIVQYVGKYVSKNSKNLFQNSLSGLLK